MIKVELCHVAPSCQGNILNSNQLCLHVMMSRQKVVIPLKKEIHVFLTILKEWIPTFVE